MKMLKQPNMINIFQPDIICLGGGISKEGEPLIKLINKHIKLNNPVNCQTTVCIAKLDNDAGIIGAANLDLLQN